MEEVLPVSDKALFDAGARSIKVLELDDPLAIDSLWFDQASFLLRYYCIADDSNPLHRPIGTCLLKGWLQHKTETRNARNAWHEWIMQQEQTKLAEAYLYIVGVQTKLLESGVVLLRPCPLKCVLPDTDTPWEAENADIWETTRTTALILNLHQELFREQNTTDEGNKSRIFQLDSTGLAVHPFQLAFQSLSCLDSLFPNNKAIRSSAVPLLLAHHLTAIQCEISFSTLCAFGNIIDPEYHISRAKICVFLSGNNLSVIRLTLWRAAQVWNLVKFADENLQNLPILPLAAFYASTVLYIYGFFTLRRERTTPVYPSLHQPYLILWRASMQSFRPAISLDTKVQTLVQATVWREVATNFADLLTRMLSPDEPGMA